MAILIKSESEVEAMRQSGKAAAVLLQRIGEAVGPGVSTYDLDRISRRTIKELGGISSFLGYRPAGHDSYPATVCTSINEEIVHGIPSRKRILNEGDIVGIDVAIRLGGYHGDNAFTFPIGRISPEARKLVDVTPEIALQSDRGGKAGQPAGGRWLCGTELRGGAWVFGCSGTLRARDWTENVGATPGCELRNVR